MEVLTGLSHLLPAFVKLMHFETFFKAQDPSTLVMPAFAADMMTWK